MMSKIKECSKMQKLDNDVDKTPASVTKFKSGGKGICYHINLNQPKENLEKDKIQKAAT